MPAATILTRPSPSKQQKRSRFKQMDFDTAYEQMLIGLELCYERCLLQR